MRVTLIVFVVAISCAAVWGQVVDEQKPDWAYAVAPAPPPGGAGLGGGGRGGRRAPDPTPRTLPGSRLQFTTAQLRTNSSPADWGAQDHPAMPDIVAHG